MNVGIVYAVGAGVAVVDDVLADGVVGLVVDGA